MVQAIDDAQLPQHGRLLRDEVGVKRVPEAIRCARGGVRLDGDDQMASARQGREHRLRVVDLLMQADGDG